MGPFGTSEEIEGGRGLFWTNCEIEGTMDICI